MTRPKPVLSGLPIVGNLPAFASTRLDVLARVWRECGPIAQRRLGPRRAYVVTSPELAQEVLIKQNESSRKSAARSRYSRPMLGNGLIIAEGDFHRRQRRLIAPSLKRSHIATSIERRAQLGPGGRVDLRRYAHRSLRELRDQVEREFLRLRLDELGWNISRCAQALGIERTNLHKRLRSLGIERER